MPQDPKQSFRKAESIGPDPLQHTDWRDPLSLVDVIAGLFGLPRSAPGVPDLPESTGNLFGQLASAALPLISTRKYGAVLDWLSREGYLDKPLRSRPPTTIQFKDALDAYTGGESYEYNRGLRYSKTLGDDAQHVADLLSGMQPLQRRQMLSRYMEPDVTRQWLRPPVQDRGLVSTTKSPRFLEHLVEDIGGGPDEWDHLRINVPRGTPAIDVNAALGKHYYHYQDEVILPPSKFLQRPAVKPNTTLLDLLSTIFSDMR